MSKVIITTPEDLKQLIAEVLNNSGTSLPKPPEKEYKTVEQLSKYIHLSKAAIYARVANNTIPHTHVGSKIIFEKTLIDEWMLSLKD